MRLELTKGLAASAVGALAVTGLSIGLPASPASAVGPDVVLLSQFNATNDASLRVEGAITLAAMKLNPAATVTFEFNTNPNAGDATPGWTVPGGPRPPSVTTRGSSGRRTRPWPAPPSPSAR